MAKSSAGAARIYLDYYDISGFLNKQGLEVKQTIADAKTFADGPGQRGVPVDYEHTHSHGGFIDFNKDSLVLNTGLDLFVHSLVGDDAEHLLCQVMHGSGAEGSVVYEARAKLDGRTHNADGVELQGLDLSAVGQRDLGRGIVLRNATSTGTVNGTGFNVGTTTLGQTYWATLRVLGGTFTSVTFQVQESQNNGAPDAYALIAGLTWTVASSARSATRVETTAATEAWKRLAITAFTGTNIIYVVTAGVKPEFA